MGLFEHYMYVLECADGTLYTGYSTDVAARVASHNSGTGAKYTKAHGPGRLVASARFYSKGRAMSAEARFKRLSRRQKDRLLAKVSKAPFEKVLCEELPGFGEDAAEEFVNRSLAAAMDSKYQAFQSRLIPNVDSRTIAGVRTPALRKIAKELVRRPDAAVFYHQLPHRLFEENQIHGFAIGLIKDYDETVAAMEAFLPYVDNWATCDQLPAKTLRKNPALTLEKVQQWISSNHCYTRRFAIGVLMKFYLEDFFEERFLDWVAGAALPESEGDGLTDDEYYVNMMRAWYFAEALAKQERAALPYLETQGSNPLLDEWTRRKAIQKAIESRRISSDMKDYLRKQR